MKLVRFDRGEGPRPGLVSGEGIIDLAQQPNGFESIATILASPSVALRALQAIGNIGNVIHKIADVRLLAPLERPGKYLAIGMNYEKHLAEAEKVGVPAPKQ